MSKSSDSVLMKFSERFGMRKNWLRSMMKIGTLGHNHAGGALATSVRKWRLLKKVLYKISDTQFAFYCITLH